MAYVKKLQLLLAVVAASALVGTVVATSTTTFDVQGRVYCDTCRAGFETNVTEYIQGAKVKIQCKHFGTDEVAHTVEGVTDSTGTYNLHVEDDHQEEICEVVLVESPRDDCNEVKAGRDRARVLLSSDSGMATAVRFANSLGFLKADPLAICGQLLRQYALGDDAEY